MGNRFRPHGSVMFRCIPCGSVTWIEAGTQPGDARCWKCFKNLAFIPCFGCGGACQRGHQYCSRCKAEQRGPLSKTPVERHVEEQELVILGEDLYRIERELRRP